MVWLDLDECCRFCKLIDYATRSLAIVSLLTILTPTQETEVPVTLPEEFYTALNLVVLPCISKSRCLRSRKTTMSLAGQVESCYCIRYLVQTELSLSLVEQATAIAEDNLVVIRIYIVEWTWIPVGR